MNNTKSPKNVSLKNQLELWLFCALIGAVAGALVWILLTNLCIQFGLKGGHFFPVIFAGVSNLRISYYSPTLPGNPEIRVVRSTMSGISRRSLFTISTSSACVVLLPILFKIRSLACWIGRSR